MDDENKPDAPAQTSRSSGRPRLPAEQRLIQRSIRLTPAQWHKIDENGGVEWLRALVDRARNGPTQRKRGGS